MADIICPVCRGIFYETTEHYHPDQPAHGAMFRMKKKYVEWGWPAIPQDAAIRFADLECPECSNSYVDPSGRLAVAPVGENNWDVHAIEEWQQGEDAFSWGGEENAGWTARGKMPDQYDLALSGEMPKGIDDSGEAQEKEQSLEQETRPQTAKKKRTTQKKRKTQGKK